ncbi:MAG: AAC(3) family N-acetyltransferase [Paludibacter sp.]|nr:AAC(3) family N-acetyltransferase [Paludibacter sp.]
MNATEKCFSKKNLIDDLIAIGVEEGDLLHLKVSIRSVGQIENGAKTLVEALLETVGENGTIVVDSFVTMYPLPLSKKNREIVSNSDSPSYAGVFANEVIKHPDMHRSLHPVHRFAAIGKDAKELTQKHTSKSNAYGLLKDMIERGAKNLTIGDRVIGVGTTHIAFEMAGIKQKRIPNFGVNYIDKNGNLKLFKCNWDNGGFCSTGYWNFLPLYEKNNGIIERGKIGNATSILTDMKKTLEIEVSILKENPQFFMCNRPYCKECRVSWNVSDNKYLTFLYNRIRYGIRDRSLLKSLYLLINKPNKTG